MIIFIGGAAATYALYLLISHAVDNVTKHREKEVKSHEMVVILVGAHKPQNRASVLQETQETLTPNLYPVGKRGPERTRGVQKMETKSNRSIQYCMGRNL